MPPFNQLIRGCRLPIPARLNPAVLAIGRLMRPDLIVPSPVFAHRGQKFCRLRTEGLMIVFQRQHVVRLPLTDLQVSSLAGDGARQP